MSKAGAQLAAEAERAELRGRRMARLLEMSSAELAELLAGDPNEAAQWIEIAAAHGVAAAQVRLGRMLLEGTGTNKDEAAALAWFHKAAKSHDPDAQNMVGRCLEAGWGCEPDLDAAAQWYRRAADRHHDWGEYNYANMLFDGRGVLENRGMAVHYYRRAAEKGHARAMNLLARCHEEGWGTRVDLPAAAHWYRRSAEAGYFRGQFNHALTLLHLGHTEDARHWLELAFAEADGEMAERIARIAATLSEQTPSHPAHAPRGEFSQM